MASSSSSSPRLLPQQRRRGGSSSSAGAQNRRPRKAERNNPSEQDIDAATSTFGTSSTSNGTRRGRLGAAFALAAFGAVLVGPGTDRFGTSSVAKSSGDNVNVLAGNLRFSRKLAADADAAITTDVATTGEVVIPKNPSEGGESPRKLSAGKISPLVIDTVHRLADPFLADESSIFAFDDTDARPVVNTFFAIRDGQTISRADAETLAVWKRAWDGFGWNPRILSIHHAEAHPEYDEILATLNNDVPLGVDPVYDRSCYLRHFAMAVNGGGWMTDYDTIPLNMNADVYGKTLPNEGQFTTYEVQVPSLIVGNSDEWDRVSRALLKEGVDAGTNEDVGYVKEGQPRLFSDMHALGALVEKDEVIAQNHHSVFQAHHFIDVVGDGIDARWMLDYMHRRQAYQSSCEKLRNVMAVHFSHSAVGKFGYGPDDRPILIAASLNRWSKLCGGPDFQQFEGVAHEKSSPRPSDAMDVGRGSIPHLLHIVTVWMSNDPYPSYWKVAEKTSRLLASSQGFDVIVWDIKSLEKLINDPRYNLEWVKPAWERVKGTGEGARLADFARMLVVYAHGGVFLDLDMFPCAGLDHLVDANGVASFPFTQPETGQVSNAAFSAPSRHPLLHKIIHFIADNPRSHIDHVLTTTGPNAVASAIKQYSEEHDLALPDVSKGEGIKGAFTWAVSGDIRLGTFRYTGHRDESETFYLYHAAFGSWIPTRADSFASSCESEDKLHLVEPYIKKQCEGNNRIDFRECGKGEANVE